MAWHRSGTKPLSEPIMVSLLTHICVTRPQLVKPDDISVLVNTSIYQNELDDPNRTKFLQRWIRNINLWEFSPLVSFKAIKAMFISVWLDIKHQTLQTP